MAKYSKLIGSVIGLAVSMGAVWGLDLAFLQTPEMQAGVISLVTLLATFIAPANA